MSAKRIGTHAKCLDTKQDDGCTLVCWKSKEHTNSSDPARREHYDPSADRRWSN